MKRCAVLVSGFCILTHAVVFAQANSIHVQAPIVLNQSLVSGVPMIASKAGKPPQIVSKAAVVMDLTTGTVVYAKNPLAPHYPASLTKIMTALIALDRGQLSDVLTASKLATEQPPDKLYLVPGEQEPLGKLLYGMLLNSANDSAVVIAQHYGGTVAGFAHLMNEKAVSLGATHTHFVNPTGLQDPHHLTTAYDLALIAQAAMKNPVFRQIVATKHFNWQGKAWHRDLLNINSMLFIYPGAIGIKTGYTNAAHETLAVAATRGNQTFLAVLLDAPLTYQIDDDATKLLNYAFAHYETKTVIPQGFQVGTDTLSNGQSLPVYTTRPVLATVLKGDNLSVQQKLVFHSISNDGGKGVMSVGQVAFTRDGTVLASEPVVATLPKVPATAVPQVKPSRSALEVIWLLLGIMLAWSLLRFVRRYRKLRKVRQRLP